MKKLILGLLSALALLPGGMLRSGDVRAAETFAVQSPRRDHCANPHANCHGERYEDRRGRYTKDSWSVYYRGRKVEGASVSSFADLGGGYGKDNWTVYYRGWKVEGLRHPRSPIWEAGTARIIGRCFTKAGSWKVPRPCRSSIRDGVTARTTGIPISAGSSSGPGSRRTGCSAAVMRKTAGRYIIGGERWKAFRLRRSNIWAAVTAKTLEGGLSGTRSAGRIVVVV